MKSLGLDRHAFAIGAALALLAGCGGSQPPIGAPGAMPQTSAIRMRAGHGKSWMLPGTSSGALIYAVGGCGGTCVLSYPDGHLVGSLDVGGETLSVGACSDESGNVFIVSDSLVTEYAHGGTSPINTLNLPGSLDGGCSVDPTTQNLAVVFHESDLKNIAIFENEQESPSLYESKEDSISCAYDSSGDLFVDGNTQTSGLSELPKGASSFINLSINGTLGFPPDQVQWDGKYLSLETIGHDGPARIQRLSISGSSATIIDTVHLRRITDRAAQSWLYKNVVVVPYGTHGGTRAQNKVGVWRYPQGGKPLERYTSFPDKPNFHAVTVSVAPSR